MFSVFLWTRILILDKKVIFACNWLISDAFLDFALTALFVKNLFLKLFDSLLDILWLAIFVKSSGVLFVKYLLKIVCDFKLTHQISLGRFLGSLINITKKVIA